MGPWACAFVGVHCQHTSQPMSVLAALHAHLATSPTKVNISVGYVLLSTIQTSMRVAP